MADRLVEEETKRSKSTTVTSLQDHCRKAILKCVTISRVHQVMDLPLPAVIQDFLTSFSIPEDFDLTGMYVDYNFNFPYHLHHRTHQIHPGVCLLDGTNVLIKSYSDIPCSMCGNEGSKLEDKKTREIWRTIKHENVQNCLLTITDPSQNFECTVFDFPMMNLQDYAYNVYLAGNHVPEFLVWEILLKLTTALLYLAAKKVEPWDLCKPETTVIDERGQIKIENLLLYYPSKRPFRPLDNVAFSKMYQAPELAYSSNATAGSAVWGIGSVLLELVLPVPIVLLKNRGSFHFPPILPYGSCYSSRLHSVILCCLRSHPQQRPSLKSLQMLAKNELKSLNGVYTGSRNLLHFI